MTISRACVPIFLLARLPSRLGDHGRYPHWHKSLPRHERMTDLNPYEPPSDSARPERGRESRSVVLLLVASGFGSVSGCIGLVAAVESFRMSQRQGFDFEIAKGLIVAAGFAALAVCWAYSFRLYWRKRNRLATVVNFGTLVCAGLFLLLN